MPERCCEHGAVTSQPALRREKQVQLSCWAPSTALVHQSGDPACVNRNLLLGTEEAATAAVTKGKVPGAMGCLRGVGKTFGLPSPPLECCVTFMARKETTQAWVLPHGCMDTFDKAMQTYQPTGEGKSRRQQKKESRQSHVVLGSEVQALARSIWIHLGAEEDEADGLALALTLANSVENDDQQGDISVKDLTWKEFTDQMLKAYTDVTRHTVISEGVDRAQTLLTRAGTSITVEQREEVLGMLRECVQADYVAGEGDGEGEGDSVEGLKARLLLARQLHAYACSHEDLKEAQQLLVQVLSQGESMLEGLQDNANSDDDDEEEEEEEAMISGFVNDARTLLTLMLCQAGRNPQAAALMLQQPQLRYRLSPPVLSYALPDSHITTAPSAGGAGPDGYVQAFEDVLPASLLKQLQEAFSPTSPFWSEHGYQPDGSTRYFSYVHPLPDSSNSAPPKSVMDQLILVVREVAARAFPDVMKAKFAEWWAHCRPHSHGHQLHFDSDNEGIGKVKNPTASMVLYLTGGVGGPTLVTTQTFGDQTMPSHGWMVHPRLNRLTVFKGNVLHGVIPGRGVHGASQLPSTSSASGAQVTPKVPFRITLMVALWNDIRVRTHPPNQPGAAQPYPYPDTASTQSIPSVPAKKKARHAGGARHTWMQALQQPDLDTLANPAAMTSQLIRAVPSHVAPVWIDLRSGKDDKGNSSAGQAPDSSRMLPSYAACYQGF